MGIVLGIEVSRLARRNADWYQLLDLCAITDTFIGDADGIYHPGLHNDRLVLGLKGTMSEAELHTLRTRLRGGILHKAGSFAFPCPPATSTTSAPSSASPPTRPYATPSPRCSRFSRSSAGVVR